MRRLTLAALCGTLMLAACSDQTQSPTAPLPSENIGSCAADPFPLAGSNGIAQQILNIYPATPKASAVLRAKALLQAGAVKLLWDTCRPAAARRAAFDFIDWLNHNTPPGKETQVQELILATLRGIGEVTGPEAGGDFGVGIFDPSNPNPTLITTLNHHALIKLEPGSFLVPTEIVISRTAGDPPLTNFTGRQWPPTYDYNAINSTNTHVLEPGHTAIIGFCLVALDDAVFPGGYSSNLGIGHNPVAGAPGFPFEILDPVDLAQAGLRNDLNCPGQPTGVGSLRSGLWNLASAALQRAGNFFLPQPLWAATLGTLPPPPPLGGRAPSLSPFRPVEVSSTRIEPAGYDPSGTTQTVGYSIDVCGDGCNPRYDVTDGVVVIQGPTALTVTLVPVSGSGTLSGTTTQSTSLGYPYTARFNDLTISAPGTYQLKVSAPGVTSYTTGVFTVVDPVIQ